MIFLTKKERFISLYLGVIYLVGIIGIALPLHQDFVYLTPLNFVVSLILVFLCEKNWTIGLASVLLFAYLFGFAAEAYGVNTGLLFGEYAYADTMGWRLFRTPLTAGLLWLIVTYGTGALNNWLFSPWHWLLKAFIGAWMLVSLDILIEPVAIQLNFWQWAAGVPPLQNFIGWYIIGFIQLAVFHFFQPKNQNKVAIVLLVCQFIFFSVFNLKT